jgi:hypothetical protein
LRFVAVASQAGPAKLHRHTAGIEKR